MKDKCLVLIADRNPHVRRFLQRELGAAGYPVQVAESGQEVLEMVSQSSRVKVLIIDPDFPDLDSGQLISSLWECQPTLTTVIHSFDAENQGKASPTACTICIEKSGNSVESIKNTIDAIHHRLFSPSADGMGNNRLRVVVDPGKDSAAS